MSPEASLGGHTRVVPVQQVPLSRRIPDLGEDAQAGLLQRPRSLPPKYFYDARGSKLFEAICATPEYYPTRTERALLDANAPEIIASVRPDHILELGSGSSEKTRKLLDAWAEQGGEGGCYWPFDVSESALAEAAVSLGRAYPWLTIRPLAGDYTGGLSHLPPMPGRVLAVFLGGTIGNFPPKDADAFLRELSAHLDSDDCLLIGMDRVKDPKVLQAAYDDAQGITAAFNKNALEVLNRELGADFDLDAFDHLARYNEDAQQVEIYLVSNRSQRVGIPALNTHIDFEPGERILTEISRKFTPATIEALLKRGGFELVRHFEPDNHYFSLVLARPSGA